MIQDYTCEFVKNLLQQGAQLIDVRSTVEFSRGALPGAVNMPIDRFAQYQHQIDPQRPVLLYCRSGQRSEMVKRFLQSLGFENVHNIGSYQKFAGC